MSDNCIWIGMIKLSFIRTGYLSASSNVLNSSPKILNANRRDFFRVNWLGLNWLPMNLIKMLSCRFEQCLRTFTILLVKEPSETELFRHLSDYVFRVRNLENAKSLRVIFFLKVFKIYARFQKCSKKFRKSFLLLR